MHDATLCSRPMNGSLPRAIRASAHCKWWLATLLCAASSTASAQHAGDVIVGAGWMRLAPQVSTEPMQTTVDTVVGTRHLSDSSISSKVNVANTLGLTATYFITDHIASELIAGIPPRFSIDGAGSASQYGKLGSARMWSPTLLVKYYFGAANAKFRPFVGVGASYIWFTDGKITNDAFRQRLGGETNVSVNKGLAPVLNAGVSYAITKHWYAGLSVSFIPVSRTLTLTTPQSSLPGVKSSRSQIKTQLNPIVTYLNIGYRF